jgi:hypothetical protein
MEYFTGDDPYGWWPYILTAWGTTYQSVTSDEFAASAEAFIAEYSLDPANPVFDLTFDEFTAGNPWQKPNIIS